MDFCLFQDGNVYLYTIGSPPATYYGSYERVSYDAYQWTVLDDPQEVVIVKPCKSYMSSRWKGNGKSAGVFSRLEASPQDVQAIASYDIDYSLAEEFGVTKHQTD